MQSRRKAEADKKVQGALLKVKKHRIERVRRAVLSPKADSIQPMMVEWAKKHASPRFR